MQVGLVSRHGGDQTEVDELDHLILHPVAVAPLVLGVEAGGQLPEILGFHRELERLAQVAEVGEAGETESSLVGELLAGTGFEPCEAGLDLGRVRGPQLGQQRVDLVAADVGDGQPEGAQDAGGQGDEDAADAQLLGERAGVQASGASEGDERQLTRVEAAFDADDPQRPDHLGVGHLDDPACGLLAVQAELVADATERRSAWPRSSRTSPPSFAPSWQVARDTGSRP